jgi:hypothetical protein
LSYASLLREHKLTPKQADLLRYFAEEVGRYEARRLRLGNASTAVGLRRKGLMRSSWGGRYGQQNDWSISEAGYELAGVLWEARREEMRSGNTD